MCHYGNNNNKKVKFVIVSKYVNMLPLLIRLKKVLNIKKNYNKLFRIIIKFDIKS